MGPLPLDLVAPGRPITGMSAVLLPFAGAGIDWPAFEAHLRRTATAGLTPAVNMDTGFVDLLTADERAAVLDRTKRVLGGQPFLAGAFTGDAEGDSYDERLLLAAAEQVVAAGGTPIVFPSWGLRSLAEGEWVAAMARVGEVVGRFYAFELGEAFVPFGRILSTTGFRALLEVGACLGAKHSSLRRPLEWERLRARNQVRPDFSVLTGNDLAIDMVIYGSDYLLGLSTLAPAAFAERDRRWAAVDPSFYELDDALQALGDFAFRPPVPAYKHSAAQVLHLRGWAGADAVHPGARRRPASDVDVLRSLLDRIDALT